VKIDNHYRNWARFKNGHNGEKNLFTYKPHNILLDNEVKFNQFYINKYILWYQYNIFNGIENDLIKKYIYIN
jgi:hypothetical protein